MSLTANFFYDIGCNDFMPSPRAAPFRNTIYLDALSMGVNVTQNVLFQRPSCVPKPGGMYPGPHTGSEIEHAGIFNNGGRDDTITGNVIVGYRSAVYSGGCGLSWYAKGMSNYSSQIAKLHSVGTTTTTRPDVMT